MRYGVVLPGGTAPEQLDQAGLAEQAGWDAVFTWEAAYGVDAWSLLAAMAVRTRRGRLGTMLAPPAGGPAGEGGRPGGWTRGACWPRWRCGRGGSGSARC